MIELDVVAIGDALGIVLPADALAHLAVKVGDSLFLIETPDGFRVASQNSAEQRQLALARDVMKERRAVLRRLAE